jgi:hypothetical protein
MNAASQQLSEIAHELEAARWDFMLRAKAEPLAELLSDDLKYVHSSGILDGKQEYLDTIRLGTVIYRSAESRIESVIPVGQDGMIINGVLKMEASIRGFPRSLNSRFVVVWRREAGAWKLVAHQTTLLPI